MPTKTIKKVSNYKKHECDFKTSTRTRVISTRKVQFPPAEWDFHTHECDFHTYECDCDYDTLECDFYTQNDVISTRTRFFSTRRVRLPQAECYFTRKVWFPHTQD
jgi:hypothetical protein